MNAFVKHLFASSALLLGCFCVVVGASSAYAAAPMAKTPAPGYFRIMLGAFEVTALSDGTVDLPVDKLLTAPETDTNKTLTQAFLKAPLETSVNAYLINTGSQLLLVDVGAGTLFGPTLGNLLKNLKASGYSPEQVDAVYITHFHGDHLGGLTLSDARAFPNASVYADKAEADYWLSKANMDQAPEDKKGYFQGAMNAIAPYIAAKKFVPFNTKTPLSAGIKALPTYGHTAGHSSYLVESEGQKLILIGDLIHVGAVQFDHPEITIAFDSDQKAAAIARTTMFDEIAKDGILIGAAHLQFPGLGHLKKLPTAYQWIPLNYTQMR